jgi:radical SAM protein with 4Fe4S-binding SPASM domain
MGVVSKVRRFGGWLGDLVTGRRVAQLQEPGGLQLLDEGDGRIESRLIDGRPHWRPAYDSYHLYFCLPADFPEGPLFVEVEFLGRGSGPFKLQYPWRKNEGILEGRYAEAVQMTTGERGELALRRCRYDLSDLDRGKLQNFGANFRLVLLEGLWIRDVKVSNLPFPDAERFSQLLPSVLLRKGPDRFHKIQWLFVELTNLCNFSCTFCPDEIMKRPRGKMETEEALRIFDQIAEHRAELGPVWPVKLHQMGEPTIHPGLVEIVAHAEKLGVGIELNTNCSLLKPRLVEGLYSAGLTNLVLSYLNHSPEAFGTRKAKSSRLTYEQYRADIERAIETKFALGARTHIELHVANAKYTGGFQDLIHTDQQAREEVAGWLAFARRVEERYGLPPSGIDPQRALAFNYLDQDENGSLLRILPGVDLMWKRIHTWGNVIPVEGQLQRGEAYCTAPYEQFVIEYNGDITCCCTDHDGTLRLGNVFEQSIAQIWRGPKLARLREEMMQGILSNPVCRTCRGWEN